MNTQTEVGYPSPQQRICRWSCLFALLFCGSLCAQARDDQVLPAIGGPGGGQFMDRCPQGTSLVGFGLRTGDDVDAIGHYCRNLSAPNANLEAGDKHGGNGGGPRDLICPQGEAIVAIDIGWEGAATKIINNVHIFCSENAATQAPGEYPTAVFDGPPAHATRDILGNGSSYDGIYWGTQSYRAAGPGVQRCPAGLVPVGINGRSGIWLDAVGLICGTPPPPPPDSVPGNQGKAPVALGRVKGVDEPKRRSPIDSASSAIKTTSAAAAISAQASAPKADPPICVSARSARARHSPAAPGLEAQCRAAGGEL